MFNEQLNFTDCNLTDINPYNSKEDNFEILNLNLMNEEKPHEDFIYYNSSKFNNSYEIFNDVDYKNTNIQNIQKNSSDLLVRELPNYNNFNFNFYKEDKLECKYDYIESNEIYDFDKIINFDCETGILDQELILSNMRKYNNQPNFLIFNSLNSELKKKNLSHNVKSINKAIVNTKHKILLNGKQNDINFDQKYKNNIKNIPTKTDKKKESENNFKEMKSFNLRNEHGNYFDKNIKVNDLFINEIKSKRKEKQLNNERILMRNLKETSKISKNEDVNVEYQNNDLDYKFVNDQEIQYSNKLLKILEKEIRIKDDIKRKINEMNIKKLKNKTQVVSLSSEVYDRNLKNDCKNESSSTQSNKIRKNIQISKKNPLMELKKLNKINNDKIREKYSKNSKDIFKNNEDSLPLSTNQNSSINNKQIMMNESIYNGKINGIEDNKGIKNAEKDRNENSNINIIELKDYNEEIKDNNDIDRLNIKNDIQTSDNFNHVYKIKQKIPHEMHDIMDDKVNKITESILDDILSSIVLDLNKEELKKQSKNSKKIDKSINISSNFTKSGSDLVQMSKMIKSIEDKEKEIMNKLLGNMINEFNDISYKDINYEETLNNGNRYKFQNTNQSILFKEINNNFNDNISKYGEKCKNNKKIVKNDISLDLKKKIYDYREKYFDYQECTGVFCEENIFKKYDFAINSIIKEILDDEIDVIFANCLNFISEDMMYEEIDRIDKIEMMK